MSNHLSKILSHEVSPFLQFVKYAIAGGVATVVMIVTFYLISWRLLPCIGDGDKVADIFISIFHFPAYAVAAESSRAVNAAICNGIGFVVSNIVCYAINRAFVFKPGRHSWIVEFLLFFAASGVAVVIGTAAQTLLIKSFGMQTSFAFAANLVSSLAINYLMRKFVIFKG